MALTISRLFRAHDHADCLRGSSNHPSFNTRIVYCKHGMLWVTQPLVMEADVFGEDDSEDEEDHLLRPDEPKSRADSNARFQGSDLCVCLSWVAPEY